MDIGTERQQTKTTTRLTSSGLFYKYATVLIAVVALSVILTGVLHTWFSYYELKGLLLRIQGEQARSAASKITQFVKEIEGQMAWAGQLPIRTKTPDEWRFDAARLFRQALPVTEIAQFDASGFEHYRSSRQAVDVIGSMANFSSNPAIIEALAHRSYYGPVYFLRESEPYMTMALAGARPDHGVVVAEVNLKFIWDVVSQIKVGNEGQIYLVDSAGRLVAHPDISLVLRMTDLSQLEYVQAARLEQEGKATAYSSVSTNLQGRQVLTAYAPVDGLGWFVFAELPVEEAFAPLYDRLYRSGLLLLAGLILAVLAGLYFARTMVVPIRTLTEGAVRLGGGDLNQRIAITTGDELEEVGAQFNRMAAQLQDSYVTLERKVEERTRELEVANQAKSRFLAAASHDLRQPLHALGLFVAQLHGRIRADRRGQIVTRIEAALAAMNELFSALLDVSKLDAGVMTPKLADFPVAQLFERLEATFTESAREKSLSLKIIQSSAWVRSDVILLERILSNLVSNAIRYTASGRVTVGCRRQGDKLRIDAYDSGPGIPQDQRQSIFGEFYRLKTTAADQSNGFGLGLSIVDRLCRLLDHPIRVASTVGKGSCFSVTVPMVQSLPSVIRLPVSVSRPRFESTNSRFVVVIDNDPLVLEGMSSLLESWGCRVVTGESAADLIAQLTSQDEAPDVIISDYHLDEAKTGIDAIQALRTALDAPIPAFLMSGDVHAGPLDAARAHGYALLHKPVDPMTLRATLTQVVKKPRVRAASSSR